MFFTGLKDDILVISPFKKFMSQLLAALLLVAFGQFEIQSFYGFLGIHSLPPILSHAMSVVFIIAIINGFNLIDGIDGLCGTIGVIVSVTFGSIFLLHNDLGYALLAFSLAGALSGFLFFNFPPARIFMGDTGSLIVGLVCSLLAIRFLNTNPMYHNSALALQAPIAIIFGIMIVPIFDTARVFTIRIAKGRSPFSPDRNHLHHMLIDTGMSHLQATLTLALLNLSFVLMVFYLNFIGNLYLIILSLSLILLFCSLFRYIRNRRERTLHQQHPTV
jgi:UDP-N-acetylmuramyl pentapeptide phosphotransferase/UDP-N-acetylglucosamine-1-phosphate transferase